MAEAVGEAQLVENGGDVVGVGDAEAVVKIIGGVDRQQQGHQNAHGAGSAQQPAQPAPQTGQGEWSAADEKTQDHQRQSSEQHHGDGAHGILDVIGLHGAAHFFQKGEVPGKDRLIPHFQLDAVGDGQYAYAEVHQSGAEKHVPEQAGERHHQKTDGQCVEHDQKRLGTEDVHHGAQRVGLAPQSQQRDAAGQGHHGRQRRPQGQPGLGQGM